MEAWPGTHGNREVLGWAVSDRDLESVLWWWEERRIDGIGREGKGIVGGGSLRTLRAGCQVEELLSYLAH